MSYNLNDNVNENFEFVLGGHEYVMRYPTVEETEAVQTALKEAEQNDDNAQILIQMYQFITPKSKDAPPIGEILKQQSIKVLQNFNQMIKAEFGGE